MKYFEHLPFFFKLADLICLKHYVFFCLVFHFQNFLEIIKDVNPKIVKLAATFKIAAAINKNCSNF